MWWLLFRANFSVLVVLKYDPHPQLHHPHRGGETTGRFRQSSTTRAERGGLRVRCIRRNDRIESPCHKSIAQTKRFLARSTNQRAPTWMRELGCWTDRRPLICHRHRMGQKDGDSTYTVYVRTIILWIPWDNDIMHPLASHPSIIALSQWLCRPHKTLLPLK